MMKRSLLPLLILLAAAGAGFAQTVDSGNLVGKVTDTEGTGLPGVAVHVRSSVLMGVKSAVSNENGAFRFANLPAGSYEVAFELDGFRPLIRKDVRVNILQTFSLNVSLTQEAVKEAIVVTGQAPTVDTQRQTRAVNLDSEFLKSIPANRNLAAFVAMAPNIVANATGPSAAGATNFDNSFNLDGVNIGDPSTGTQYVNFGMDIMQEISVQTGALSAEFGSVRGAMINVVTKSGGNRVSGTASFFYNHEKLKSDNTQGTPLAGTKSGAKYELEPSLSIGGPIVKDKLWFFLNGSFNRSVTFNSGFPWDDVENPIGDKLTIPYPYAKLTFQPDQKNKFVVSYSRTGRVRDNRNVLTYYRYNTAGTTVEQHSPTDVLGLQWTRFFGSNVYANLKFAMVNYMMKLDAKDAVPMFTGRYSSKSWGAYWRNKDYNPRDRYGANFDMTTFIDNLLGTHELKVGLEAQLARTGWQIVTTPGIEGISSFSVNNDTYQQPTSYYRGLVIVNNGFDRKENLDDYFGFIQDTWRVNRHLTLNLGLRLEYNSMTWPKQGDPSEGTQTLFGVTFNRTLAEPVKAFSWTTLAPRLGLIYDLSGDSKTLLKVSWSRFTAPNMSGWVNLAHPNGWVGYYKYQNSTTGAWDGRYAWWAVPSTYVHIGYNGQKLKAPYTDELSIGGERELFTDWSVGLRYLRRWDRRNIQLVDSGQLDIDKLLATGEFDWSRNWETRTVVDPFDGQLKTFYNKISSAAFHQYIMNPPGADRNYKGLELTVNKRFSRGWALNLSYTYADAQGLVGQNYGSEALGTAALYQDPNYAIYNYGHLDLESRHQLKVQGLLKGPLGINLSGYFRFMSGLPYARTITASKLGLTLNLDETNYAEPRGSRLLPATKLLDLRLEKVFKIDRLNLAVFADCFNVFNQGVATGVWTNSSSTGTYDFEEMMTISTPRIFQLGVRVDWN